MCPLPLNNMSQSALAISIQERLLMHAPAGASGCQRHLGVMLQTATAAIKSTQASTSQHRQHIQQSCWRPPVAVKLLASGFQGHHGTAPPSASSVSNLWCLRPCRQLRCEVLSHAWRSECNDRTGASGFLCHLCNMWPTATPGQLQFLLHMEVVRTGVDGVQWHPGSTSLSANNALQHFQKDKQWLQLQQLAVNTGANGCLVLPGSTSEAA